ncbi:MAG TPA: [FeFe] hydrogenase H-cluster radical SAM maturase HydG, partial [Treponemataceae bacterium]|nr:[FeFe] hydrogenase H-cluster radical SAM maturase HydG [Treponemataceae bacterium]
MKDDASTRKISIADWQKNLIKQDEIDRYLIDGKDFIDDDAIEADLAKNRGASPERVRAILKKAHDIKLMDASDVAALVTVTDPALRAEVFKAAEEIKTKVYDNRIVTFAPLYCGSKCVNACKYCGFRCDNNSIERRVLTMDEVESEARVLAGKIGHKRLVIVFGEHPETGADY